MKCPECGTGKAVHHSSPRQGYVDHYYACRNPQCLAEFTAIERVDRIVKHSRAKSVAIPPKAVDTHCNTQ